MWNLGKFTAKLKEFRADFQKVKRQLTNIESKIDPMEGLVSQVQQDSRSCMAGITTIEIRLSSAEKNPSNQLTMRLVTLNEDLYMPSTTVENVDNLLRKNYINVRGFKERLEGDNLVAYLVDLFAGWAGSD